MTLRDKEQALLFSFYIWHSRHLINSLDRLQFQRNGHFKLCDNFNQILLNLGAPNGLRIYIEMEEGYGKLRGKKRFAGCHGSIRQGSDKYAQTRRTGRQIACSGKKIIKEEFVNSSVTRWNVCLPLVGVSCGQL